MLSGCAGGAAGTAAAQRCPQADRRREAADTPGQQNYLASC